MLEHRPKYWRYHAALIKQRVGDFETAKGRADLLERSPITHVEHIQQPLLVIQGANDPRVMQRDAERIVDELVRRNVPVVYGLFPNEGHGFHDGSNFDSYAALVENFLAGCLGGKAEPFGDALSQSTLTVPVGSDCILGLRSALGAED